MCSGKRRGRAALRQSLQQEIYEPPYRIKPLTRADIVGSAKPKRKAPEASFQIQTARFLSKALPEGYFWTTIPSGGGGLIRGARLKAMGLRKGLPDMVVFGPYVHEEDEGFFNKVLWLELKAAKGSLSQEQKQVISELKGLGHRVEVVKTLDQVEAALAEFCFPDKLRAKL